MLFGIEADCGTRITGYCVPDSFSSSASLQVHAADCAPVVIRADEPRPSLVTAGRHATGLCGFTFDATIHPGLAAATELVICEAATGTIIYRRGRRFAPAAGAFFRLETHLRPLVALDDAFDARIAQSYPALDRVNLETLTQVFCLARQSIYVGGRLSYRSIEPHLAGFRLAVVVQDPFVEMAERLIVLRDTPGRLEARFGARQAAAFAPAAAFAQRVDQAGDLRKAFKRVPQDVDAVLGNPLLRQLGTHSAAGALHARSLPLALNILAGFEIVVLREDATACRTAFAHWLKGSVDDEGVPPSTSEVVHLSARLKDVAECAALIAGDLELYGHVAAACRAADAFQSAA